MTRLSEAEVAELREAARSESLPGAWRASARACTAWDRAHPLTLEDALDWIDALRAAFGDPPVDRTPWRAEDLRI
jgi:hypothetical protein